MTFNWHIRIKRVRYWKCSNFYLESNGAIKFFITCPITKLLSKYLNFDNFVMGCLKSSIFSLTCISIITKMQWWNQKFIISIQYSNPQENVKIHKLQCDVRIHPFFFSVHSILYRQSSGEIRFLKYSFSFEIR